MAIVKELRKLNIRYTITEIRNHIVVGDPSMAKVMPCASVTTTIAAR